MPDPTSPTSDTLWDGAVALAQPARAEGRYRVNVDAIHLAAFAAGTLGTSETRATRRVKRAFDLGAGVGAVGLSLLHLEAAHHVTMVEVDRVLADLATVNSGSNGWSERMTTLCGDVADESLTPRGAADLVVCNPPYVPPGRGHAPLPSRARARSGTLDAFLDAARRLAGRRARVCFVYPAIEATTLFLALRARGLEPKRLRAVHGASPRARVVLVEAVAGKPGGLVIEAPLLEVR